MTKTLTEQQIRKIIENGTRKAAKVGKKKFYGKPKSLTEQWREGTLSDAEYYVKNKGNVVVVDYYCELTKSFASVFPCNVKEVLAPVPDYDEFKQLVSKTDKLEKQLEIATKALKEYADSSNWYETDDFGISAVDQFACDDYGYNIAQQALKEMAGVK